MSLEKEIDSQMFEVKKYLGVIAPPKLESDNDSRTTSQKIIGSIGLFGVRLGEGSEKALDALSHPLDSTKSAFDSLKGKITDNIIFIAKALNLMLKLAIQYILNIFFLYFLMPLLYFYIIYKVVSGAKIYGGSNALET